jgi:hypothetical protein
VVRRDVDVPTDRLFDAGATASSTSEEDRDDLRSEAQNELRP